MNETKSNGSQPVNVAGNKSSMMAIAMVLGVVLITCILAGCFLTALIMILDAIPFHHLF